MANRAYNDQHRNSPYYYIHTEREKKNKENEVSIARVALLQESYLETLREAIYFMVGEREGVLKKKKTFVFLLLRYSDTQ